MARLELKRHPDSPSTVEGVEVVLKPLGSARLLIRYVARDLKEALVLPSPGPPTRTDGLWRTTCFEAFFRAGGEGPYVEFNFSPSTRWAAYRFDDYRAGMEPLPLASSPVIEVARQAGRLTLEAILDRSGFASLPARPDRLGLSAVLEESGGRVSFWALDHGPGAPDFHHASCFAGQVPAATGG